MAQLEIPNALTSSLPPSIWGKVLGATPVIMTVIATCLAGLASSEMTRAQYDRSWAAQLQSKASDEWGYFQAKRLRSILQSDTLDLIQDLAPLDPGDGRSLTEVLLAQAAGAPSPNVGNGGGAKDRARMTIESPAGRKAAEALAAADFRPPARQEPLDPRLDKAFQAIAASRPDAEIYALQAQVTDAGLERAFQAAQNRLLTFDARVKPPTQWADEVAAALHHAQVRPSPLLRQLRLRYDSRRYEAESRLDQQIATFYELKVRRANITADRHRDRSQRFFVGMLAAQAAVVIATFALAARQKSLLWSFAAAAGTAAVAFSLYVYLFI